MRVLRVCSLWLLDVMSQVVMQEGANKMGTLEKCATLGWLLVQKRQSCREREDVVVGGHPVERGVD